MKLPRELPLPPQTHFVSDALVALCGGLVPASSRWKVDGCYKTVGATFHISDKSSASSAESARLQ